ncbi:1821_t:CDS:2, partial [Funneliformis caledonium]
MESDTSEFCYEAKGVSKQLKTFSQRFQRVDKNRKQYVKIHVNQPIILDIVISQRLLILWYLLNKYTGIFDITYTERQSFWISQRHQNRFLAVPG